MPPWLIALFASFFEQGININEGRRGEERANQISKDAVARFQPDLDALQSGLFGSGGSFDRIGGLLNDPGLTPDFTPPPDLSGQFGGQLGEFLPGGANALTPSSDFFNASRDRIGGFGNTGFLDPLRNTPSFTDLRGQLPEVSTDLSAERTAELSNLAQAQRQATGQALQDVLGFRGRFSPEELSQVQQDRSRELAEPFQIAAPQVRAQFATGERELEQQQRLQDQQLLQFREGLVSQQKAATGGIEAQLRGSQISAEAGFAPAEVLSGIQQGEFNLGVLGGQADIVQQDFLNIQGQEREQVQNFMSLIMAELQKAGIDINAFLNLTNTATGALTGQNIFVPQVDLTSTLEQHLNRQAAQPEEQGTSFAAGIPGLFQVGF